MATRVMIMAGGTGGHVFPAIAVADFLRAKGCSVTWLGAPNSFEAREVPKHGYPLEVIDVVRLRGQTSLSLLAAPYHLIKSINQAMQVLKAHNPNVVLGMGGFVSGPGGLAAALMGIPLVIHEQNTIPGLTNRWLSRIAKRVIQAFPNSLNVHDVVTCGNPIRESILNIERHEKPDSEKLKLLVIGGSLGARALNEAVPEALSCLLPMQQPHITHQVGLNNIDEVMARYTAFNMEAEVVEFIDDMASVYAEADIVVCRAGALTVSEVSAAGIPAIFIPFPHAVDDHQTKNALYLVESGGARIVRQSSLTAENLATILKELVLNRDILRVMSAKAKAQSKPNATACVAEKVLEVAA